MPFSINIVNNVFTESANSTLNMENERPCLAQAFSRPPLKQEGRDQSQTSAQEELMVGKLTL